MTQLTPKVNGQGTADFNARDIQSVELYAVMKAMNGLITKHPSKFISTKPAGGLAYGDLKGKNSLSVDEYTSLSEDIHDKMFLEGLLFKPQELRMFHSGRRLGKSILSEIYKEYINGAAFSNATVNAAVSPCGEAPLVPVSPVHTPSSTGAFINAHINQTEGSKMVGPTDMNNLISLAKVGSEDEFSQFEQMPESIKKVLKRKAKEQEDAKVEAAAESILKIVNKADSRVQGLVGEIRRIRRLEKQYKAEINELMNAKAFGMETQNFIPIANMLGYRVMDADESLTKVPATFKPKGK